VRYFLGICISRLAPYTFPCATLFINISASFFLGFLLNWTSERVMADPRWRTFLGVGFCATYSTYSSYATFAMMAQGQWQLTFLNILCMNALSLIACAAGIGLARAL
jgi:CrcB protein